MDEKDIKVIRLLRERERMIESIREKDQLIANLNAQNTELRRKIVEISEALDQQIETQKEIRTALEKIRAEINHR